MKIKLYSYELFARFKECWPAILLFLQWEGVYKK